MQLSWFAYRRDTVHLVLLAFFYVMQDSDFRERIFNLLQSHHLSELEHNTQQCGSGQVEKMPEFLFWLSLSTSFLLVGYSRVAHENTRRPNILIP